jgi:hypothetical protein
VDDRAARRFFLAFDPAEPDRALAAALAAGLRGTGCEVVTGAEIAVSSDWAERVSREIGASGFFVLLLSAHSVHSEAVREEARFAHDWRNGQGTARLLPVRVNYDGPLGYLLGPWVNPTRWADWHDPADTQGLLKRILDVAEGRAQPPPMVHAQPSGQAPTAGFRRPAPMADLSSLNAPGGTLAPTDPFYIDVAADRELQLVARRLRETVVIKAPRQYGKSSLLARYLAACAREGKQTVLIDLSLFPTHELVDYATFLSAWASALAEGLELEPPEAVTRQAEMSRLMSRLVLKQVTNNLVVAFDEADRVLGQPYQSDFFSLLRAWCNQRANPAKPDWARFELALVISTEPYLLIRDAERSPFNIGVTLEPQPFDAGACRELNRLYGSPLSDDQTEGLRRDLLGGHPFLTRLAYYVMTRADPVPFDGLMRDAHRPEGPFGDHLRGLLAKLQRYPGRDLVQDFGGVIRTGRAPDGDAFDRLRGAGLVRREGDRVVAANGLYARFFGGLP